MECKLFFNKTNFFFKRAVSAKAIIQVCIISEPKGTRHSESVNKSEA
jgi:hypothetical protein